MVKQIEIGKNEVNIVFKVDPYLRIVWKIVVRSGLQGHCGPSKSNLGDEFKGIQYEKKK
jgi:hypothetical protein